MKRLIKSSVQHCIARAAPLTWRRSGSLLVLMYHRVLPPDHPERALEQPGMYVTPETLRMHAEVAREFFDIVHLDDWLATTKPRRIGQRPACAFTFDDGWRDNFDFAFPILRQTNTPATIFLVSSFVGTQAQFWPNRLSRLLAEKIHAESIPLTLSTILEPLFSKSNDGTISIYDLDEAIQLCKALSDAEMNSLLAVAEADATQKERSLLSRQELQTMAASGLIRFGSHTRTHYRCRAGSARADLEREIKDSRAEISSALNQPANLFCYPNGDTCAEALELVGEAYDAAVTTKKGWYREGGNRYLIPRVGVHEDVSSRRSEFLARISCWI